VIRAASPKLGAYAGLGAFGLLAALVLGRPELAAVGAPFALLAALGLALARDPHVDVGVSLDRERVLEGEEVLATLDVESPARLEHLELVLVLPSGLALTEGRNPVLLRLAPDELRTLELRLRCDHWGGYVVGDVALRGRDPLGLFRYEQRLRRPRPLRVYPRPEELRALLPPLETQVFTGNQVSRTKGEGIEFADLRPFVPGDRVRRINWRASARRGALWVNERHPERNTDVIVFLDTFTEARGEDWSRGGTLDMAVRAAATLAGRYLQRKDRVGLVSFGGVLAWLLPATGPVQLYRIVESLIDTEITLSYAWKDVDVIPKRTLPPKALILAVTPLLDERAVGTLLDLRARGFDLAVIEVSPVPFVEPGSSPTDRLAHRVWLMKRRTLRARYERVGVPIVEWRDGVPLASPVEEVTAFRRHARHARA
jgi:uncharacterized protein (DUF58 family)